MARLGLPGMATRRLVGLLGLASALAAVGCEVEPPAPRATRARPDGEARTGLKSIEMIPSPKPALDQEAVKAAVRIQAGFDTVRVQVRELTDASPAGAQADLLRKAILQKPPAIVVEVPITDDPELVVAAAEARKAGIPVVSLGRPLGESAEGPGRSVLVAPKPFDESAEQLVSLAIRNAANAKLDPKAGALITALIDSDPLFEERIAALNAALKNAGVEEIGEVRFDRSVDVGKAAVIDYLNAHPKATLILAADSPALTAAYESFDPLQPDHPFILAGYSADEQVGKSMAQTGEYAALALYAPDRLIRKGINVAARLARGAEVLDRVEIESVIVASSDGAGLPIGRVNPPDHDDDDDLNFNKPTE